MPPRNVLYHVKYTGGDNEPLADFDIDHPDRIVVTVSNKQIAGQDTRECGFDDICNEFADLRWPVSGRNVTKSSIQQKDEDPHEFLIFVSYLLSEDVQ